MADPVNAELEILAHLTAEFPDAAVGHRTPAAITGPTIRSVRSSGEADMAVDHPIIEVDTFDLTYGGALTLGLAVRDAFLGLAHTTIGRLAVLTVTVSMGPRWLAWDNTDVSRFGATYALTTAR